MATKKRIRIKGVQFRRGKAYIKGNYQLLIKGRKVILQDPQQRRRFEFNCNCTERRLNRGGSCDLVMEHLLGGWWIRIYCQATGGCTNCGLEVKQYVD